MSPLHGIQLLPPSLHHPLPHPLTTSSLSSNALYYPRGHPFKIHPRKISTPTVSALETTQPAFSTNWHDPIGANGGNDPGSRITLRDICSEKVPEQVLRRAEELGFAYPTAVQVEALPILLAGRDSILHAQTGSGKTLSYLLPIFSKVNFSRAAVQAIIVVPTRELGMQVVRVARRLAGKPSKANGDDPGSRNEKNSLNVMALLEGGTLTRQKAWLKAEPPQVVVGTLERICRMIEMNHLRTKAVMFVVIDEIDAMLGPTKQAELLRKLLTVQTFACCRQTIFASATIPQHSRFARDCVSKKWAKEDLIHIHTCSIQKMPLYVRHRYVICDKTKKLEMLTNVLQADAPKALIIFVNEQTEKEKRIGAPKMTNIVAEFLLQSYQVMLKENLLWKPVILEEDSNINARTSSLLEFQQGRHLLVATDLAARGLDLPDVNHIYNLDLPSTATSYVHRAGRTGRKPLTEDQGTVTTFVIKEELFALRRLENELMFENLLLQVT